MTSNIDAYSPQEIAAKVETIGVVKATAPFLKLFILGILAGAFIAFGAMLFTLVITDSPFGFGPTRFLGGIVFSLGLILVVIAGAELFTGNNLIVIAWVDKKISHFQLLRNWSIVYLANFIGAVACAVMFSLSGVLDSHDGGVLKTATNIAQTKVDLTIIECVVRGILCNTLVCMAVWLSYAAHHVSGKILAIILPIAAFVALGFEHSIANMYFIPVVMLSATTDISLLAFAHNLFWVTFGNIIGGSLLVAIVYWACYIRDTHSGSS